MEDDAEFMPFASVALDERVGAGRSHAAGRVGFGRARILAPYIEEGLNRRPAGLDAVGALEQRLVADEEVL